MFLQWTHIKFPAPMRDGSQLSVAPAPRGPLDLPTVMSVAIFKLLTDVEGPSLL